MALDMSKFFDTNYHYMVPELDDSSKPSPDWTHLLEKVISCRAASLPKTEFPHWSFILINVRGINPL